MFDGIGEKIKSLATVICWIGIALSCILGFITMISGGIFIVLGLFIAMIGSLLSWVGSFVLYGYGQIVENTDALVENSLANQGKTVYVNQVVRQGNDEGTPTVPVEKVAHWWRCDKCGGKISRYPCPYCGHEPAEVENTEESTGSSDESNAQTDMKQE